MAADYWQERFKGKNVAMDMTMIYIIVAFATVLLNNVFLTLVPYRVRVAAGKLINSLLNPPVIPYLPSRLRRLLHHPRLCRRLRSGLAHVQRNDRLLR